MILRWIAFLGCMANSAIAAEPTVSLPAEVAVAPGRLAIIPAKSTGTMVRWLNPHANTDLAMLADDKSAAFVSPMPGRFTIYAWTAAGDMPSVAAACVVIVGDAGPAIDPLIAEFRKLAALDGSVDSLKHVKTFAGIYRDAAKSIANAEIKSLADVSLRIKAAAATIPAEALTALRSRIAEEIAKSLPLNDALLDASTRATAAKTFTRIATCLEALP
jgi:hypothetical protein